MGFGNRLKELREEKEITQKELGKILNISDRVIGYYEANSWFPKDEVVLKKIADYFEVSIDYLVDRTTNRKLNDGIVAESRAAYMDLKDLPDEAVKRIEEYVDLLRLKYSKKK